MGIESDAMTAITALAKALANDSRVAFDCTGGLGTPAGAAGLRATDWPGWACEVVTELARALGAEDYSRQVYDLIVFTKEYE